MAGSSSARPARGGLAGAVRKWLARHHAWHGATQLALAAALSFLAGAGAAQEAKIDLLSTGLRQHAAVMLLIDPATGRILDANAAAAAFYGYPLESLVGRSIDEFNRLGADEVAAERARAAAEARNYFVFPHRLASGETHTVEVYSSPITLDGGRKALLSIIHDLSGKQVADHDLLAYQARLEQLVERRTEEAIAARTELERLLVGGMLIQFVVIAALVGNVVRRRQALRALAHREEQLSTLVDALPDVVCFKDGGGRWQQANAVALHTFGLDPAAYRGQDDATLARLSPPCREALLGWAASDESTWQTGRMTRLEEALPNPSGQARIFDLIKVPLFETDGSRKGLVVIGRDISERKRAEAEIERLAFFDPLTGLPNRRLLLDRIANALATAHRGGRYGAVLLVDLDAFKTLNEARGHDLGDRLLKEVGRRLVACLRESDTIARVGGDEFALLLPELSANAEYAADFARAVAEKVLHAIAAPCALGGEEFNIGASIGAVLFPTAADSSVNELLKQTDTALYQAKAAGRRQVRFFEPEMQARVEARFALETDLRHALGRAQLRLFLQPQVSAEGEIVGAEALLRWQHPSRGLVPPAVFVPIAEETGLILDIGDWILSEACRLLTHPEALRARLRISVNVSPRQFHRPEFVGRVRRILSETGAPPARLTLEITEGVVIDNVDHAVATMSALRELGVRFSIDDFGTGYSSLVYLKRLPLNELKIDKAFVQDAPSDASDAALVDTILAVATHLRLDVVAEGVETAEQAAFLRSRRPMHYQGYYYGRPEPAEKLFEALAATARA